MLPQTPNLTRDQRKLLKFFKGLSEQDQESLLAFAEFLEQRSIDTTDDTETTGSLEPIQIERPAEESVVAAIKRLSASYHMLDRELLLTETSSLMTAHLVNGRSAPDVIDDLEVLFIKEYSEFISNRNK